MKARCLSREVFVPAPAPGVAACSGTYYTRPAGTELVGYHKYASRSDTIDQAFRRFSPDNGRTWSGEELIVTGAPVEGGMLRRHPRGGYADPKTGRYFVIWTEGVLPTDHPLEGLKRWKLYYTVSEDGGRTEIVREQIVHEGAEFSADHPLPGVWVGRNCVMLGDLTCRPVTRPDGAILVPCQITPVGPDGEYYNPGGGLSYHFAAVLIGRWRPDGGLAWQLSEPIEGDPARTTRGMVEPTIEYLDNGRLLMIMRGSNDAKPDLPGYKWRSFSADNGRTWSPTTPWTYEDGSPFFSPSACSQLLRHSSGRLLWLGNISPVNPQGNWPRYPFVIGEVDRQSGLLIRDSVSSIDTRAPDESARMTLSNFYAREDRETGHVILHMTRLMTRQKDGQPLDWTADALQYRIEIG